MSSHAFIYEYMKYMKCIYFSVRYKTQYKSSHTFIYFSVRYKTQYKSLRPLLWSQCNDAVIAAWLLLLENLSRRGNNAFQIFFNRDTLRKNSTTKFIKWHQIAQSDLKLTRFHKHSLLKQRCLFFFFTKKILFCQFASFEKFSIV